MKIKYNEDKDTYTVKGLTTFELSVINTLLSHVRLGQGEASDVAFNFTEAFDQLEFNTFPDVVVYANPAEELDTSTVLLESPVLDIYVN